MSFAKRQFEISLPPTEILLYHPLNSALILHCPYRLGYGDNMQSCLTPLDILNGDEWLLSILIVDEFQAYRLIMKVPDALVFLFLKAYSKAFPTQNNLLVFYRSESTK